MTISDYKDKMEKALMSDGYKLRDISTSPKENLEIGETKVTLAVGSYNGNLTYHFLRQEKNKMWTSKQGCGGPIRSNGKNISISSSMTVGGIGNLKVVGIYAVSGALNVNHKK